MVSYQRIFCNRTRNGEGWPGLEHFKEIHVVINAWSLEAEGDWCSRASRSVLFWTMVRHPELSDHLKKNPPLMPYPFNCLFYALLHTKLKRVVYIPCLQLLFLSFSHKPFLSLAFTLNTPVIFSQDCPHWFLNPTVNSQFSSCCSIYSIWEGWPFRSPQNTAGKEILFKNENVLIIYPKSSASFPSPTARNLISPSSLCHVTSHCLLLSV